MTALKEFQRLECQGIWRATPDAQRRDVIVALGDATLTLSDQHGTAIVHWSLPAVERLNASERPALFSPGADAADVLELTDETMIKAIGKVQTAIERRRPHPGRLRFFLVAGAVLLVAAVSVFWLPRAMVDYTASVVPPSKRSAIGQDLLANIRRVAGKPCETALGTRALRRMQQRLFGQSPGSIVVLSGGVRMAEHLPGHIIVLNRALVEDFEDPEVAAGFVIAEDLRARQNDPLVRLLRAVGITASFRLLTTGNIAKTTLAAYAEDLLTAPQTALQPVPLLARFQAARFRSTPYAYALDVTGETTLALIEADPMASKSPEPILSDGDWVSLQGICGE